VAIFGIAFAIAVYAAIGERQPATQSARPSRFDPKAVLESIGSKVQQVRLAKQDYVVEADRQLTYEDGSTKLVGVRIKIPQREGRDVMISGNEAQAGKDQKELHLTGAVKLASSDGFEVVTDSASFDQESGVLVAPGAVEFKKGGLSGSGVGMTYDDNQEILSLTEMAHVLMKAEDGTLTTEFTSGAATLARHDHLELIGNVHALREQQVLEADHGLARLTPDEEHVTFIELRGNSRVAGGKAFDSMSARDIDLAYSDDGSVLQRVVLNGGGAIAMTGQNGAMGRQFIGDTLSLAFAPDESLTSADGLGSVRVNLPGAAGTPGRTVTSRAFDAKGEPGAGLTSARFTENVEYREEGQRGAAARTAQSRAPRRRVCAGCGYQCALHRHGQIRRAGSAGVGRAGAIRPRQRHAAALAKRRRRRTARCRCPDHDRRRRHRRRAAGPPDDRERQRENDAAPAGHQ
jgi:LPS export ABC transporter protein LptC